MILSPVGLRISVLGDYSPTDSHLSLATKLITYSGDQRRWWIAAWSGTGSSLGTPCSGLLSLCLIESH